MQAACPGAAFPETGRACATAELPGEERTAPGFSCRLSSRPRPSCVGVVIASFGSPIKLLIQSL